MRYDYMTGLDESDIRFLVDAIGDILTRDGHTPAATGRPAVPYL